MAYTYEDQMRELAGVEDRIGKLKELYIAYKQILCNAKYYYEQNKAVNTIQLIKKITGNSWALLMMIDFMAKSQRLKVVYTPEHGIDDRLYVLGDLFYEPPLDQWDFIAVMNVEIAKHGLSLAQRYCEIVVEDDPKEGTIVHSYLRKIGGKGYIMAFVRETAEDCYCVAEAWANENFKMLENKGDIIFSSEQAHYSSRADFTNSTANKEN